ncbi:MAG: hypothetical protein IRZ15_11080 [Bryobacteraceae bacterium]|nr:hypothetical protein [Bryobacteraceae bacterium]
MASLATFYGRLASASRWWEGESDEVRRSVDSCVLRPLPNEDVHFFIKKIDNSLVVREADPQARTACVHSIAVACIVAVLVIAMLLPGAYGLLAGYQIERLKKENEELQAMAKSLEIREAELVTPQRLEELAKIQRLVDPAPDKVVYLEGSTQDAVAMNLPKK